MSLGDFNGDQAAVTLSVSPCEAACPGLTGWPVRNLIENRCPECGTTADPEKTVRELRRRRVREERYARLQLAYKGDEP